MSELPSSWVPVELCEIADVRLGRQRSPSNATGPHMVPYLRAANVTWNGISLVDVKEMNFSPAEQVNFRLRRGDILLSEASGSPTEVGKPAIWNEELPFACFQNTLIRVRLADGLDSRFFFYKFLDVVKSGAFADAGKGIGINHLGGDRVTHWPVDLPPLPEQQRIVAKLDSVLAKSRRAREALDAIPPLLEQLRQSTLAAAFRGDLTADWRAKNPDVEPASELLKRIRVERRQKWEAAELAKLTAKGKTPTDDRWKAKYVEPEPVDDSELPELPKGWCWAALEDVTDVQLGQQRSPEHANASSTVPYIRAANITWRGLDMTDVKEMGFPDVERYRLEWGDVLLSEASGSPSEVGKPAIWRNELPTCCYQKTLIRLRGYSTSLSSRWLHATCLHDAVVGKFAAMAPGVGILHLTAERMLRWPIAVAPQEEQTLICDLLDKSLQKMQSARDIASVMLAENKELDGAALAKAFRGELVPQDPNDEPAAVMLERLRAERAAKTSPPRGAKARATSASPQGEGDTGGEVPKRRGRPKKG